ncbi:MAG: Coenzyme F420 hydrogenase/dehydrogenase, beta subunit C-terminal domain [Spirochaetaceae bacterium]|nr:MAG: Coenzyme F420 hydrogenase/dehydrogenase, beta subunit C-terminal domain [Spirochaetaceae bacterium]
MSRMLGGGELKDLALPEAIRRLLATLMQSGAVRAVLVPKHTPAGTMVTQVLVTDWGLLDGVDPLAPVQMINAAHAVRELAKEPFEQSEGKIAAVLRPCEVRAVIELAKLKQILPDALYLIGYDCPGVYDVREYRDRVEAHGDADKVRVEVLECFINVNELKTETGVDPKAALRGACQVCTHFTADSADLNLSWVGTEDHSLLLNVLSEKGEQLVQALQGAEAAESIASLQESAVPPNRPKLIEAITARRLKAQEQEQVQLLSELQACIRCYNCREVCPICYCKECLLKPEKMGYSSERYLRRAQKKGQIKMPVDTVLYHLTKMNHMASSCVACGLCEQACPMEIPLGRIYSRVGRHVQALFNYLPGRRLEEQLPVTTFKEEELPGVEDIKR